MASAMDNEELMDNEEPKVEIEGEKLEDSSLASVPASDEEASGDAHKGERQWFVIHCYSGYENKVRKNLEQRIETMNMKDKIFDVFIPTQDEIEVRDGKRRTVERHVFPGYVLVEMILEEDSWFVVRNTPGVTGFVGMGDEPTPLRPEEVAAIMRRAEDESPTFKVTYHEGDRVRIIDGPFNDSVARSQRLIWSAPRSA